MRIITLLSFFLFASQTFAADLDFDSVKKRLDRNVQLLAAISLKGAEAPAVAEIIKNHIDIYNEIVKEQEKLEKAKLVELEEPTEEK